VAIARALAMDPICMLFDEPTSALDPEMINEVLDVMVELAQEGMTMMVRDARDGLRAQGGEPRDLHGPGQIVEDATKEDFFGKPRSERAQQFRAPRRGAACRWWCSTAATTAAGARNCAANIWARCRATRSAPAVMRELHMDRATPLVDFAGRRTTSADFSKQMQAQFAPTVMFHGPTGGQLAEPIVGFRLADFYGAYLDRAIEESRKLD
jgi:hypothetical protein